MKKFNFLIISLAVLTSCIFVPPNNPNSWITNTTGKDLELIVKYIKAFLFREEK
jgi:hypothetical protein